MKREKYSVYSIHTTIKDLRGKVVYNSGMAAKTVIRKDTAVNNYEDCVKADYVILYPDCLGCLKQCVTPDGEFYYENTLK